jgi:hypothetical protein
VVAVQVAHPDGVDVGQRQVLLQRPEGTAAEFDHQPEAVVLDQVARPRRVRPWK